MFQLFGIIGSISRDIFRIGKFMTEHNLGEWDHILNSQGITYPINGNQVAVFNIDGKFFLLIMNVPTGGGGQW